MADRLDVIMAGYPTIDPAKEDFGRLMQLVKARAVKSEGLILVERDADGEIRITETGDHLGRRGLGWGGGVGVLVGLLSPPLLAATAVGAAAGGLVGKFAKHKVTGGLKEGVGRSLKPGMAAIVAIVAHSDRPAAARALAGAPAKSVAEMDEHGLKGLKSALAEAAGKFNPDRTAMPIPDRTFGGAVGRTLDQSVPDWSMIPGPTPPEGAPNVLFVLIDDAGFGNPATFGGPIATPNMTRVAEAGLTYNRYHVTAMCAPTRAATLTGRNNHAVGFGSLPEFPGPFPGYTSMVPRSCTPFPRILRDNGYATAGFGKWHLTPEHVHGAAGPFDHWPIGWGFNHFWGFLTAESGQYDPLITQDNTTIGVPEGESGEQFYLPDALTDRSVAWLHRVRAQDPVRPWFLYYATGCAHAPHQVPVEWSEKYRGKFDQGWDRLREETLERQKELGVVPEHTELTPRPDAIPAWDSLSDNEKKLYARQMEVFAGYSENADHNVGRLLDAVEEMGELDNTLVFYIWGDNGSSLEGTVTGTFNEMTTVNGIPLTPAQQLDLLGQYGGLEAWGTDAYAPHYAAAWAMAGNTPFKWGKQVGSHLGGTRAGMVVAWPERIGDAGGLRTQFSHCIDIGPTILEAAGIPEPTVVDGFEQEAMHGTSIVYTFDDAQAEERHTVQYWETYGNRAIYKDGWWACAKLDRDPWDLTAPTMARFAPGVYDPEKDTWELYYLPDDFSQAKDLSAQEPEKLAELQELFWLEAEKYRVLPLLGGLSVIFGILPPLPTTTRTTFFGDVQNVTSGLVPRIVGRSYALEAELTIPEQGAEGVIVAEADDMGGFALWVDGGGLLHHTYSWSGVEQYRHVSTEPLPTGDVTVQMRFAADELKPGTGGDVSLWANGKQIGGGRMEHTVALRFTLYSGMDVGRDNGLTVDAAYREMAPYAFTGTVKSVVFDLETASHEDEKRLHAASGHASAVIGSAG
jgi:arylsulfatase